MSHLLDLTTLKNCADSMRSGLLVINDLKWFNAQSEAAQKLLISGIVKNFEFVYEVSVKMIKRFVESTALIPEEIDQLDFREILRKSAEIGIIENVSDWFEFRKLRNTTAHTYDNEKAHHVESHCNKLLVAVDFLIAALSTRNEQ